MKRNILSWMSDCRDVRLRGDGREGKGRGREGRWKGKGEGGVDGLEGVVEGKGREEMEGEGWRRCGWDGRKNRREGKEGRRLKGKGR